MPISKSCISHGTCAFHLSYQIYWHKVVHCPYYSVNICKVYSDIACFISNIGK